MRIHQAVGDTKPFIDIMKKVNVENVLISYAFFKSLHEFEHLFGDYRPKNLILDSGAFSVWSRGEVIDIDKYGQFCKEVLQGIGEHTNVYCVNLDVLPGKFGTRPDQKQRIESAEAGWANMLYLENTFKLKVIPVFHQHEPFEWLDRIKDHTDYFGVSPANDVGMDEKLRFLNQSFARLRVDRTKYKTHGFAVTAYDQITEFPFFSVDSSSWAAGARYGRIPLWNPDTMKMENMMYKDINSLNKFLEHWPKEYSDILTSYKDRAAIGIISFQMFEKFITRIWEGRGLVW